MNRQRVNDSTETKGTSSASGRGKPPFEDDQGLDLLIDRQTPQRRLRPESFRSLRLQDQDQSRGPTGAGDQDDEKYWKPLTRQQLLMGNALVENERFPMHRVVVTTDAGIGKTTNMKWLAYSLNLAVKDQLAMFLLASELTARPDKLIEEVLIEKYFAVCGTLHEHRRNAMRFHCQQLLEQRLRRGQLILVIDGLDQVGAGDSILRLQELLADPSWRRCRLFLSGRPHALHRNWDTLFAEANPEWSFVRFREFTPEQQKGFLGEDVYDRIPEEARGILSVPRVLQYIRKNLTDEDLKTLRTPSDVYFKSIRHMVEQGLCPGSDARRFGRPPEAPVPGMADEVDDKGVMELLSAIAFQMTSTLVRSKERDDGQAAETKKVPNFDRVGHGQFPRFRERLRQRISRYSTPSGERQIEHDLRCLDAMNSGLSYGIFDVDKLSEILWRDRTLQEFLTAYWMCNHFDGRFVEDAPKARSDAQKLRDWLHLPHVPATEDYYWVWRYATEMPRGARSACHWLEAMRPLYEPGDQQTGPVKRSTEMLYRSWETMSGYAEGGLDEDMEDEELAQEIVAGYQGEIQRLCEPSHENQEIASRLLAEESYELIPPDKHWNGSRVVLQIPDKQRKYDDELAKLVIGKRFLLAKAPVTNVEYELFDPTHRNRRWPGSHAESGEDGKGDDRCPVVEVSWYDGWAYCLWLGGYLPTEEEWEYACRAGSKTAWCFGDDEEQLKDYAWYSNNSGYRTHPVGGKKPNGWGLYDMHGNVDEWCDSWHELGGNRVCRGGRWGREAWSCRSADRHWGEPSIRNYSLGFRVAQVPSSKSSK